MLLLNAGEVVSSDRLIDELWGESPPSDAQTALQAHVSRLRKVLEPDHGGEPALLLTQPPGYLLSIADDQLDLRRFDRLVAESRRVLEEGRRRARFDARYARDSTCGEAGRWPTWRTSRSRPRSLASSTRPGSRRSRRGSTQTSPWAATPSSSPSWPRSCGAIRCASGYAGN